MWLCMTLTPVYLPNSPMNMEDSVRATVVLWLWMEDGYHDNWCLMMASSEQTGGVGFTDIKRRNGSLCFAGMCSPNRDRHSRMRKVGCSEMMSSRPQDTAGYQTVSSHPQNTVPVKSRAQPCFFEGLILVRFKLGANQSTLHAILQILTDIHLGCDHKSMTGLLGAPGTPGKKC